MAQPILSLPKGYYPYIPTDEEKKIDNLWSCAICLDGNKKENRVHHLGEGGRKHPFHTNCLQPWAEIHKTCPSCRADPTNFIGLVDKTKNLSFRFLNRQLSWISTALKPSPKVETLSGIVTLVAGVFTFNPILSIFGCLLQAHGAKRIHTPELNVRLNQLKEIEHCARSLALKHYFSQDEINLLIQKIENNQIFNREIIKIKELLMSRNPENIEDGLEMIAKTCDFALLADTMLHGYRVAAILGLFISLYQANLMGKYTAPA